MSIGIDEGYQPGCIGRIVEMHATYYAEHAGFGVRFESQVATQLSSFCEDYVEGRDGLWLVKADNRVEGSIAIDGAHAEADGAHLRWFIVSERLRGTGAGGRLLSKAVDFCRDRGYESVHLWTFEGLAAARHLYEKQGFRLVHQQRGRKWGYEVNEQRFDLRFQ